MKKRDVTDHGCAPQDAATIRRRKNLAPFRMPWGKMKTKILKRPLQAVALLLFTGTGDAHHSTSTFDSESEIVLEGSVKTVEWGNPHVYVTIETEDAQNETVLRRIEGPSPAALTIAGWSEQSLVPGDRVVVLANPSRDRDSTLVLGNSILKEGGDYLPMGGIRLQEALAGQREQ